MNTILLIGTRVVVLALVFYSIGIIIEQRKHRVTNWVLVALTLGILLDVTATVFMIIGSPNSPFTLHGFLGYTALLAMLIDTILMWRHNLQHDSNTDVPQKLHIYSRLAYSWWLIAFITGSLLVALN